MKRVIITGCNGMLGKDLLPVFEREYETIGVCRKDFDITELNTTINCIKHTKPDIIIHSAAYTDVDGCEKNTETAFVVNSLGARNIAIAAQEVGSQVVYISSDYVYDGEKQSPYFEYDMTNPLSIYGRSKLEGENMISRYCNKYYILRTSWLFGSNGKNFVKTMLELSKTKNHLQVVDDQIGSPTYTPDLAEAILKLVRTGSFGIYHLTNSDYCSWYDFARFIFQTAGIEHVTVEPVSTESFGRPARRPKNSRLEKLYWKLNGFEELRSFKEAAAEYINLLMERDE